MAIEKLKKLWKNEYFQTVLMVVLVVIIVFGFWNGMVYALGTPYPMVAVEGPSMCTLPGSYCDGWTHPFERTLHDGDLVLLQGVDPKDISNGTIIVYRDSSGRFIIHRVINIKTDAYGKLYFTTKGDGNPSPDQNDVPQENVIGRVICRVPWIGKIALFMRNSFVAFIVIAIILLLIFELVFPALMGEEEKGKTGKPQEKSSEPASET